MPVFKMVVEIRKSKNPEYTDTLGVSNMMPYEYVIFEKHEYDEPIVGTGQYGEWHKYNIKLHEYVGTDPNTGEKVEQKYNDALELGYFASAKGVIKVLDTLPLGVKVKMTQEKVEGKSYKLYNIEKLDKVVKNASVTNANPDIDLDTFVKNKKAAGLNADETAQLALGQFDVDADFVKARFEVV